MPDHSKPSPVLDSALRQGYSAEQAAALAALADQPGADPHVIAETLSVCRLTGAHALAAPLLTRYRSLADIKARLRDAAGADGRVSTAAARAVELALTASRTYGGTR